MHTHSRRGFLSSTFSAWFSASLLEQAVFRATLARAQSPGAPTNLFDIQKVAPNVYAAIARPNEPLNCNAAIFETDTGLLIVDAHSRSSAAAALAAQLRKDVTTKPIQYIVNTHFHWDHSQGNPGYPKLS